MHASPRATHGGGGSTPKNDAAADPSMPKIGTRWQPLFDDPSARALSRVGVVVGEKLVRMVVFDGACQFSSSATTRRSSQLARASVLVALRPQLT